MIKQLQLIHRFLPVTYPYQDKLILYDGKELIINKSRQIGISYIIGIIALTRALFMDKKQLIISPSLKQSTHVMEYVYQHLNKVKEQMPVHIQEETKTSLIFNGGGEIHSLPNSANTIRGYPADDIWIDEYAHFTNGTDKEIVEAVTPSITRGGRVYKISTPFGNQNRFYNDWNRPNIDKMLINWRECPHIKPGDIELVKNSIGDTSFNQEYENQFLSDSDNQEFPFGLITSCIDHELEYLADLDKNRVYYAGADIGRKHDLTALTVFEKKDNVFTLVYKKVMKNTPYNEQLDFFQHLLNNYKFLKFRIDETGIGNMLSEELHKRYGHINRITFNNENKQDMVSNIKRLMQEGNLRIPNDTYVVDNIRAIKRVYSASNYLRFESDHDTDIGHADLFWSMALGLYDESKRKSIVYPACFNI